MSDELRRVLVLYTGGTIGMVESGRGFAPERGHLRGALEAMPRFRDPAHSRPAMPPLVGGVRVEWDLTEWEKPLDSSNMARGDWVRIAADVVAGYDDYDGFVVLHGTDTMAYSAAALSFMLENLGKPVVLTGSQIPLSQLRSDGADNLLGALTVAGTLPIPEVGLFFRQRLLRGNRAQKVDATGLKAFESGNLKPLVEFGVNVDVHEHRVRAAPTALLELRRITNENVAAVRLFPGLSATLLRAILRPPLQGLVLETYGVGNGPEHPEFLAALREATDRGVVIVSCTQCHRGSVNTHYAAGAALAEAGVVGGGDMTPEAALTKLAWLLSQGIEHADIVDRVGRNLRGELTETARR